MEIRSTRAGTWRACVVADGLSEVYAPVEPLFGKPYMAISSLPCAYDHGRLDIDAHC